MSIELINELVEYSRSCLPRSSVAKLAKISKQIIRGKFASDEDLYISLPDDNVLILPISQLPEVWLNILHIYCFKDYTPSIEFIPKPRWVVIDLGAYIGIYTLYALGLMGWNGTVLAVEPNPLAVQYLRMNIDINGLSDSVIIEPIAITSNTGYTELYVSEYWGTSTLFKDYLKRYGYKFRKHKVRTLKVDELVRKYNLSKIDLMKIDVEGSEELIVNDLWRTLRHTLVEKIVIEVHRHVSSTYNLMLKLRSLNYEVWIRDLGLENQLFIYAIKY